LVAGKTVIDFGCGDGYQSLELAESGAARVIGLDVVPRRLENARRVTVGYPCEFAEATDVQADVILSVDAFEHFEDVPKILETMASLLKPGGCVLAAFGPTWLHPYGGHLFSVFPWAHLIFSEAALIRWRSDFRDDGAKCFGDVEGGLNKLTIRQFERYVEASPLRLEHLEPVPIKGIKALAYGPLREFGSWVVKCKLSLPSGN
jgi:SAM-dependent methyltransferase